MAFVLSEVVVSVPTGIPQTFVVEGKSFFNWHIELDDPENIEPIFIQGPLVNGDGTWEQSTVELTPTQSEIAFRVVFPQLQGYVEGTFDNFAVVSGVPPTTAGAIITEMLDAIQLRGGMTQVEIDFTASNDSDGNLWANPNQIAMNFGHGQTLAEVLGQLVGLGFEWEVAPKFAPIGGDIGIVLSLYNGRASGPSYGVGDNQELTQPLTAATIHQGQIMQDGESTQTIPPSVTWGEGAEAQAGGTQVDEKTDADALAAYGRREDFFTNDQALDGPTLSETAKNRLANLRKSNTATTVELLEGSPYRPGIDFQVGDTIKADLGPRLPDGWYRVARVGATLAGEDDQIRYVVDLGQVIVPPEAVIAVTLARLLDTTAATAVIPGGGSTTDTTSGSPGTTIVLPTTNVAAHTHPYSEISPGGLSSDLAGQNPSPRVVGIQGNSVLAAIPADRETLVWNEDLSAYEPGPLGMQWLDIWEEGTYLEDDVVRDGAWTMIANTTTDDVPAPQPVTFPAWLLDDAPAWTESQVSDVLTQGIRIHSLTELYYAEAIRVWIPDLSAQTVYQLVTVDNISGAVNAEPPFVGSDISAIGWFTVGRSVVAGPGDDISFMLISHSDVPLAPTTEPWTWTAKTNASGSPGAGNINARTNDRLLRINDIDDNSADQSALLASVSPGTIITITQQSDGTKSIAYLISIAEDQTGFWTYVSSLLGTGAGGEPDVGALCDVDFENPLLDPMEKRVLTNNWLGNAVIDGVYAEGTATPAFDDNAYGVDLLSQIFEKSPDWDIVAVSSVAGAAGGAGGGGAQVLNDLEDVDTETTPPVAGDLLVYQAPGDAYPYLGTPANDGIINALGGKPSTSMLATQVSTLSGLGADNALSPEIDTGSGRSHTLQGTNRWWQMELTDPEADFELTQFALHAQDFTDGFQYIPATVQAKVGGVWTTVGTISVNPGQAAWTTFAVTPVFATGIRIEGTINSYLVIGSVEIWGTYFVDGHEPGVWVPEAPGAGGIPGHVIRQDAGAIFPQRTTLNFAGDGVTVTDGLGGANTYYQELDQYTGRFSLTLADDSADRLALETPADAGTPTYNHAGAPTQDSTEHAEYATGDKTSMPWNAGWETGTYVIWYKGTGGFGTAATTSDILFSANTSSGAKRFLVGILAAGTVQAMYGDSYTPVTSVAIVNDDEWHMISFVVNGSSLLLYIDGVAAGTASAGNDGSGSPDVQINYDLRNTNYGDGGGTAEFASVDEELDASAMAELYASRLNAPGALYTTVTIPGGGGGGGGGLGSVISHEVLTAPGKFADVTIPEGYTSLKVVVRFRGGTTANPETFLRMGAGVPDAGATKYEYFDQNYIPSVTGAKTTGDDHIPLSRALGPDTNDEPTTFAMATVDISGHADDYYTTVYAAAMGLGANERASVIVGSYKDNAIIDVLSVENTAADLDYDTGSVLDVIGFTDEGGGGGVAGDPFWATDVDDPLTTLDAISTGSGTWSINTYLQCVLATSTQCRAISDDVMALGAMNILEVEMEIPAGFTTSGQHVRIGLAPSDTALVGSTWNVVNGGIRGDGQVYFEEDGLEAHPAGPYTIPTAGTWVAVRLAMVGNKYSMWFDDVLVGELTLAAGVDVTGESVSPYVAAYSTAAMTARFRNLKAYSAAPVADVGYSGGGGGGSPVPLVIQALEDRTVKGETVHAADDEFNGDTKDVAWNELVVTGTTVWSQAGGRLAATFRSVAGSDGNPITKLLGSLSHPLTIETAIDINSIRENYTMAGLCFTEGNPPIASSNHVVGMPFWGANDYIANSVRSGTWTNITTDHGSQNIHDMRPLYHRMIWVAANTFKMQHSHDGINWLTNPAGAFARTLAPTEFGLWVTSWGGSAIDRVATFEYFRVTEADLSL